MGGARSAHDVSGDRAGLSMKSAAILAPHGLNARVRRADIVTDTGKLDPTRIGTDQCRHMLALGWPRDGVEFSRQHQRRHGGAAARGARVRFPTNRRRDRRA